MIVSSPASSVLSVLTPGDFRRRVVLLLLRKLCEGQPRASNADTASMSRTIRKPLMNGDDGDFGVYGSEAGCRSWAERSIATPRNA
jgi:hypothetical protein